ncbi:MAG: NADH-dependent [FeFe] hydrogenase, group A6 [Micrococcales bacterium]|nr:NADH-dependent [FeFe] hydrogenase, group A6 [Micrococcales bacterium]
MVRLEINGHVTEVEPGTSILDAARGEHIEIPTACYLKGINQVGACRLCAVEVEGNRYLMTACETQATEGMVVRTNSPRARHARKVLFELIMSDHPMDCLHCARDGDCELQDLGRTLGVSESRFGGPLSRSQIDDSSGAIVLDASKCILCRRCVAVCNEVQEVGALNIQNRGFHSQVGPGGDLLMDQAACSLCGQCTVVCPVDAIHESDGTQRVWDALADPTKTVVVQTAPAVRVALGEEFGMPAGTLVTGKMVTALRDMGFDYVFDTDFAADLTIMEEGYELLGRLVAHFRQQGAVTDEQVAALGLAELPAPVLPMITSCSPGWIKYVEHFYADQLAHLSSCKSPHMMLGALIKSWFATRAELDPKNVVTVSVMPCTAKKFEIDRPEMSHDGMADVDAVITTRELGRMLRQMGIDFVHLADGQFDSPMGTASGAGDIFGATGGVAEAALRTIYEVVTGRVLDRDGLQVGAIRGLENVKSVTVHLDDVLPQWSFLEGVEVPIGVTSGLRGAGRLMDDVVMNNSPYLFIEVMGCPGGCISGGGQPRPTTDAVRRLRLDALYRQDASKPFRRSHTNPAIAQVYAEFLGEPDGHVSHRLLHTHYTKRTPV